MSLNSRIGVSWSGHSMDSVVVDTDHAFYEEESIVPTPGMVFLMLGESRLAIPVTIQ